MKMTRGWMNDNRFSFLVNYAFKWPSLISINSICGSKSTTLQMLHTLLHTLNFYSVVMLWHTCHIALITALTWTKPSLQHDALHTVATAAQLYTARSYQSFWNCSVLLWMKNLLTCIHSLHRALGSSHYQTQNSCCQTHTYHKTNEFLCSFFYNRS